MKLISIIASAISVASVAARPLTCGDPADAVPFYRIALPTDHFYTANLTEFELRVGGGLAEGPPGRIFTDQALGTVPLYRLYSQQLTDHHYTRSVDEKNGLVANTSYYYEGIAGYVYPDTNCGGIPLYRSYNPAPIYDHFFTSDATEWNNAVSGGWAKEGIAGYILPL